MPVLQRLSGIEIRRLSGAYRLSRSVHPGGDRGKWLDGLAADPLLLHHREQSYIPIPRRPPPFWLLMQGRCLQAVSAEGREDVNCVFGNMNWLGTDDQGRDVTARLIYGFRISVLFGLILTVLSSA
jgi:ABC-type dipeptide/oligopeptide/nickel transport system permease subunit